ncbi:MAG: hypothetical protein FWD58_00075 [Firmicutes bacterium]|nr:hypothetical protein [Bacillota bacterium]
MTVIFASGSKLEPDFQPDTSVTLVITGIITKSRATRIKKWLLNHYAGGLEISLKSGEDAEICHVALSKLDKQQGYGRDFSAIIPAQSGFIKPRYGFADLVRITERLTAPDGCPWDQVQTHASIAKNATEEAAELVAAIEANDVDNILEESGDVLLQGVFHGDIARRAGEFTIYDVIDRLCKKLVSRHTHVFGSDKAANAEEALRMWNNAKTKEKGKQ